MSPLAPKRTFRLRRGTSAFGVKRTSKFKSVTSVFDPKRTSEPCPRRENFLYDSFSRSLSGFILAPPFFILAANIASMSKALGLVAYHHCEMGFADRYGARASISGDSGLWAPTITAL